MSEDDALFNVQWRRPNDAEILECHGLTAEQLAFRIRAVIRMCGSVELLSLVPVPVTELEQHR